MRDDKIIPLRKNADSKHLSSVKDEMESIDYELRQILESADAMTRSNDSGQDYHLNRIRQRVNTILARTHRAIQISEGKRVPKA